MKLSSTNVFCDCVVPTLHELSLEGNTGGIAHYDVWLWSTPGANPPLMVVNVQ